MLKNAMISIVLAVALAGAGHAIAQAQGGKPEAEVREGMAQKPQGVRPARRRPMRGEAGTQPGRRSRWRLSQ